MFKIIDAVRLGQVEDVSNLIKKGLDVNEPDEEGEYPVILAAKNNNFEIVKLLIESKANLNLYNKSGDNAQKWAQINENEAMVDMIKSHNKTMLEMRKFHRMKF